MYTNYSNDQKTVLLILTFIFLNFGQYEEKMLKKHFSLRYEIRDKNIEKC